ncbi:MAG TPA: FtsX-like permease family protein [Acidimicrobiales bacterium]|nr:FtsX-like permease family protein [Acidimicrobiales bacterium]
MTAVVLERPSVKRAASGGAPARRAIVRWGVRLFRREWRQQLLVLALLVVAVAATVWGVAVATNAAARPDTTFVLQGNDRGLGADIAAIQATFGPADVVAHQTLPVPGSLSTIDLRAVESGHGHLRLVQGRLPVGPGDVAVTRGVATTLDLRLGVTWQQTGHTWRVVGVVEDPADLHTQFAVVVPGTINASTVTVEYGADIPQRRLESLQLPSGTGKQITGASATAKSAAAVAVLALETLGLLFVGLVGVAGFSVMAHRRQRAFGMLGSIGATDRHVRLLTLANGAVVGATGAVAGAAIGLGGWLAFAPQLETMAGHRIDRFDLPWWAIGVALVLAVSSAVLASWWPARAASRASIVASLSGRPPRPQPATRSAAVGAAALAGGVLALAFSDRHQPLLIIGGSIATVVGVLFVAPLAISLLARAGRGLPVAVRLALRDLARYQARSGAALGAATLAIAIASTVTLNATAQIAKRTGTRASLPANELMVYPSALGGRGLVPAMTEAQLAAARGQVDQIVAAAGARGAVELERAVSPTAPVVSVPDGTGKEGAALVTVTPHGGGEDIILSGSLYVATPAVLAHYGIAPGAIDPTADVVTSRNDIGGLQLNFGMRDHFAPKVQRVARLPRDLTEPNALITPAAVHRLGLEAVPAAWLVEARHTLTGAEINGARKAAAASGLVIETQPSEASLTRLAHEATTVGILLALGVLAVTAGLIRSETANDLRVLTAAGAGSTARRTLTAATTGALALLAGLLGAAEAYLAAVAFWHSDLHLLSAPPWADLVIIVAGLPLAATAAGWLLAGREPPVIARQPLD